MPCVAYTFVIEYDVDLLIDFNDGEPLFQAEAEEQVASTFADDIIEIACEQTKYIIQDCDVQWSTHELEAIAATQAPPVPPITDEDIAWEDVSE